jgi:hypothetical protein
MTEPEETSEEEEEVESISISWFSANSISSIRGASSKIIKEMKKNPNSPFLKKVRATNDELNSIYGQSKHFSNNDWERINKMWEETFGSSSKWWGYGVNDGEKNTS